MSRTATLVEAAEEAATALVEIAMGAALAEAVAAALAEEGQETGSARAVETTTLLGTPTAGGVVTRAEQGKTHGAFGRTRRALAWSRRVPLNVVK